MEQCQTQLTDEIRERRRPDYVAKMPVRAGQWQKVGVAFFNPRTESITIYLDVMPDRGKVVLFRA